MKFITDSSVPTPSHSPALLRWRYGGRFLAGLSIAVLFSHLGYLPMDTSSDEARRALVALEMILSDDYITPTVNGIRYLNKPPLYNWLIIASYQLFGNYSSLALRFPMAVSLVFFGFTIFGFVRRHAPARMVAPATLAFAAAMMLVTNARVWLYDSLLGLIDITFSWVTYTAFLLVYHFDRRQNYWALFLTTYALTAISFLMKGLPAVVFQGLTLLSWFIYTKQFRRLFTPAHVAGIASFVIIVGAYYWAYFSRNHIPISELAGVLFDQSAKRTVIRYGFGQTLMHVLTYPFEMMHLFAPYTALVVLLIRPSLIRLLRSEPFIAFNALTFIVNFAVYWTSPQTFARYLFSMLPLLFTVFAYLYYERSALANWRRLVPERIWQAMAVILTVGCWTAVFYPETRNLDGILWKTSVLFCLLGLVTWAILQPSTNRLSLMIALMVVVRIGYNWIVLPPRIEQRKFYQDSSEHAAKLTLGAPLYGYKQTIGSEVPNDVTSFQVTDINSFHIAAYRGNILRLTDRKIPGAYYIADSVSLLGERYDVKGQIMLFDRHPAYIVQFKP